MPIKDFFKNVLAGIIGVCVLGGVFNVIFVASIFLYAFILKPVSFPEIGLFLTITGWIILVAGFLLGYRSRKHNNFWFKIFYPSKQKILISVALAFILSLLIGNWALLKGATITSPTLIGTVIGLFTGFIISFYPFSALIYFLYKEKTKKEYKQFKVWIVVLIIILNPVFVLLADLNNMMFRYTIFTEPCGLKIESFTNPSSAVQSGIQIGEVITEIDGVSLNNIGEALTYLSTIDSPKIIRAKTKENEYSIQTIYSQEHNKYIMGVNLREERCKKPYSKILRNK